MENHLHEYLPKETDRSGAATGRHQRACVKEKVQFAIGTLVLCIFGGLAALLAVARAVFSPKWWMIPSSIPGLSEEEILRERERAIRYYP